MLFERTSGCFVLSLSVILGRTPIVSVEILEIIYSNQEKS